MNVRRLWIKTAHVALAAGQGILEARESADLVVRDAPPTLWQRACSWIRGLCR